MALPYLCARTARRSRAEARRAQVLRRRLWDWHVSSWRCDGRSGQSTVLLVLLVWRTRWEWISAAAARSLDQVEHVQV